MHLPTRLRFASAVPMLAACLTLPLQASACPTGEVFGDPEGANVLHLHADDGSRTLRFGPLTLLAEGEQYRLELPVIDDARLVLVLDDRFGRTQPSHEVAMQGSISGTPCPTLPDNLLGRNSENGQIEFEHGWPRHDGSFAASVVFKRNGEAIVEGEFNEGIVIDVTARELATPGTVYRNDEAVEVDRAVALYRPDQQRLEIRAVYGWGSLISRGITEFDGQPGVFVETRRRRIDGEWVEVANLHLVHAMDDDSLHYEHRQLAPDEALPDDLSLTAASDLGERDLLVQQLPMLTLPERPVIE